MCFLDAMHVNVYVLLHVCMHAVACISFVCEFVIRLAFEFIMLWSFMLGAMLLFYFFVSALTAL